MAAPSFSSLNHALVGLFGTAAAVARTAPVSGGDINRAYRLTLADGTRVFMKANAGKSAAFFAAEAEGLAAIARTGTIHVPRVLGLGTDERHGAFLLLEWIESAAPTHDYWETFAQQLAALHSADTAALVPNGVYGFQCDNYIGERPQVNMARDSWVTFFRDCRLAPQLRDSARYFDTADRKRAGRLLEHLDKFLLEPERPSLLHGDLWSGNFITGSDGHACLIDPAVYVGNAEADLAMTELFGGFRGAFYDAYRGSFPLQPGYERRRDRYNLYHLLNHLNLFGPSYLPPVRSVLKEYG